MHAAASAGDFWGTDFNPAQVVNASQLAEASAARITCFRRHLREFAKRSDFTRIRCHSAAWGVELGVATSQGPVLSIIRRKLRPGGLVYISYNCLPGWAPIIPIRQLMALYRDSGGGPWPRQRI